MYICRRPRIWETGGRTKENDAPFRDTWIHKDLFKCVIVKTLDWSLQTKTSRSQNLPFGNVLLFLYSKFCPENVIVSKCKQTISSHLFLTLVYFHFNFPQFDSQHSKKNNPAPSMLFKSTKLRLISQFHLLSRFLGRTNLISLVQRKKIDSIYNAINYGYIPCFCLLFY